MGITIDSHAGQVLFSLRFRKIIYTTGRTSRANREECPHACKSTRIFTRFPSHVDRRFGVRGATFSNANWQQTLDKLSERAEGHPKQANAVDAERVESQMSGSFTLGRALLTIPDLQYEIPGAKVNLAGKYGLDGKTFDFAGTVQTEASASGMLTGWKHWAAMPFDPLLKKDGAGMEVPVKITGTKSDMKFGVDMGKLKKQIFSRHKDQSEKKTQDDKIVGDPARVRPQLQNEAVPPRDQEPSQQ